MTPIVCLHAFPLSASMYSAVDLPGLITPDMAGFGSSEIPDAEPDLDVLADEVIAELDRRGLDRVVLGGVSMGGYVTMAVLRRHAERVSALILVDTKAAADTPEAAANRRRMADSVLSGGHDVDDLPARMLPPGSALLPDVLAAARAARPAAVAWAQRAMAARPDSFDVLRAAVVPALVVVGEHDVLTPSTDAVAMVDALPDAQMATIAGAGHLPPWERPDEFTMVVRGFLSRLGYAHD